MNKVPRKTSNKVSRNFKRDIFKFPAYALKVHKLISTEFIDTYILGGAIRNLFLKKKITDIDIATSATPKQIIKILTKARIKFDNAHEKFGVIIANVGARKIEITTFRTELYVKGRFPKVGFTKSPKKDSNRRDFTINSIYYSPTSNRILDFYKGQEDIKTKTLRFIGNAEKRVQEDPLRIIRAFRFALQYNLKFEIKTKQALQNNLYLLQKVSATRLQREINQISLSKRKKLQKTLQKVIHSNT